MYAIGLCDDYFDSIEIATVVLISLQTAEVEKVVVVPEYTRVERIQLMRKFDSL